MCFWLGILATVVDQVSLPRSGRKAMIYRRNGIRLNHTITYLSYIPPWAHDNALDTLASLLFVLFLVSCLSHTLSKVYLTRLRTSRYLLSSARLHVFLLHFFFVTYLHCWLFFFHNFFVPPAPTSALALQNPQPSLKILADSLPALKGEGLKSFSGAGFAPSRSPHPPPVLRPLKSAVA